MSDQQVHKDDLDDVIEIAARLQDRAAHHQHISLHEVEEIAGELGISPQMVREALGLLERQRAEERTQEAERQRAQRQRLWILGAVLASSLLIVGVVCVGLARSAGAELSALQSTTQKHQLELKVVVDRQAALTPQLLAMLGGNHSTLQELQQRVLSEPELSQKLLLSQDLGLAMANAIGALPPAQDDSESQARLNFQYEVTGSQNRISTERQRYQSALTEWSSASSSTGAKLAVALGWAEDPAKFNARRTP